MTVIHPGYVIHSGLYTNTVAISSACIINELLYAANEWINRVNNVDNGGREAVWFPADKIDVWT